MLIGCFGKAVRRISQSKGSIPAPYRTASRRDTEERTNTRRSLQGYAPGSMTRPTRQEQAAAILDRKARQLASRVLGRRADNRVDFAEAFNLERIDLLTEIGDADRLLGLGRNRVGPQNGLYVLLDDDGTYRCYLQEHGVSTHGRRGMSFGKAREYVIDLVIEVQGLPFTPEG